MISVSTLSV